MSDESRGGSPDWIRNFQTPCTGSILSLSSDSSASHGNSFNQDLNERDNQAAEERRGKISILIDSGDEGPDDLENEEPKKNKKQSSSKGHHATVKANPKPEDDHNIDEEISGLHRNDLVENEKPVTNNASSRLPLVMSDKVQRSKALVECDDESIDLSGDVGAVGRVVISETGNGSHEMLLDLKGTIYKTTIVPSRTFCVVSFGPSEAKVEAIMNDFIQIKSHPNVFEAETVVEGILDGFSFDMDDDKEGDPKPTSKKGPQGGNNDDHLDERNQGKLDKKVVTKRKKATIAAKPPKKAAKKTQTLRKAKTSKK